MKILREISYLYIVLLLAACGNKKTSTDTQQSASTTDSTSTPSNKKTILFFGDSLTAGYGLDDPSEAFPGVIQRKIDAQSNCIDLRAGRLARVTHAYDSHVSLNGGSHPERDAPADARKQHPSHYAQHQREQAGA